MGLALTTRLIQLEEGCKLSAYRDSRGIWTIGYGYNLEAHGYRPEACEAMVWSQEQADSALADEIQAVLTELDRRWPDWRKIDEVRQAAIVSSVYQLGVGGAVQFKGAIAAIQAQNWANAASHIRNSRWATQTPARVERNARMIETGQWPEGVNGERFQPVQPAPVAPASVQPPAPVLPSVSVDVPAASQDVGKPVGGRLSQAWSLTTDVSKLLGKHPSTYGAAGLFSMLVGNVRMQLDLWIFEHHYHFQDANVAAALAAIGVVAWGLLSKRLNGGPNA